MRRALNGIGVWLAGAVCVLGVVGCAGWGQAKSDADGGVVRREAPPTYAEAAQRYNERVAALERFRASVNVQFRYRDEQGDVRTEQPDGQLQVVRPDRLALSLGKAGKVLFWFGSDAERYWWLDMTEEPVARLGRHAMLDAERLQRLGMSVPPLDLIVLLGIVPLDEHSAGATQWSKDGRELGITCGLARGGSQRVWVDPGNYRPRKIEVFGEDRRASLVAVLSGEERVDVGAHATVGGRPSIPGTIWIYPQESGARVRITLTDVKDRQVSDKAFVLEELLKAYSVERTVDLDR